MQLNRKIHRWLGIVAVDFFRVDFAGLIRALPASERRG